MALREKALCTTFALMLQNLLLHTPFAKLDANETVVQSTQLSAFALDAGIQAADDEPDYTCDTSNPCKLGCCGSM